LVLVKVLGRANRDLFHVVDGFLDEGMKFIVVVREDVG